jgi:hypothetical protein
MRRSFLSAAVMLLPLVGALSPAALAQDTNAPPGNSGVDQYLETVPEAGGNRPAGERKGETRLPARTREQLKAAGADGEAIANLVGSTGPSRSERSERESKGGDQTGGGTSSSPSVADSPRARNAPGSIAAPTLGGSGTGGMGLLLPVLLALSALGAVLLGLRRRRQQ